MTHYIVMGVSGCGKTSIGMAFAHAIKATFVDGDDLQPAENVAKMAAGEPLDDANRQPWIARVAGVLRDAKTPLVVGCSALKRQYRDWIRTGAGAPVTFLHLSGSRDVIGRRMAQREGHFMPLSLLESQFATLEPPQADEASITVDIDQHPDWIVGALLAATEKDRR